MANTTTPNIQTGAAKVINPEVLPSNNRLKQDQDNDNLPDYLYDAAGNVTQSPTITSGDRTFIFDGENKQTEVRNAANQPIGQYIYDGDGKRVKKLSAAEITIFVYDAGGKLVAEYANQIASGNDAKVSYLTTDNLGTPRINTDQSGAVISRHDYQPFGEDIASSQRTAGNGYQADAIRKQFTSYERDTETDLDFAQARMYSNKLGRFTSVDPLMASAKPILPESWNRYSYSFNNPLRFTDPDGLEVQFLNGDSRKLILETLPEKIRKKVEAAIGKDGIIKKGALDKIVSKDKNFLGLKEIVNDKRTLEITTGTGFQNPNNPAEQFYYKDSKQVRQEMVTNIMANGSTKQDAEKMVNDVNKASPIAPEALFGVFQTEQETGGNARVTISDGTGSAATMPYEERVGTAGHETFGHALLYFQGKPYGHGDEGGKPYSYFTSIEERSKANFRGQQKLANPQSIKPKQK